MNNTVILILAMAGVGVVMGLVAGPIWRERPYGFAGDLVIGVATAVAVGFLDWFVIPAMGFSQRLVILALALEPALGALLVLWLVRRAKRP